jgi:hypothetical protein
MRSYQIEVLSDSDGRTLDSLLEDDLGLLGQLDPALLSVAENFFSWGLEEEGVLLLGEVDLLVEQGVEGRDPGGEPLEGEDTGEGSAFGSLGSEGGSPFAGLVLEGRGDLEFGPLLEQLAGSLAAELKEVFDDGDGGETFVDVEFKSGSDFGGHGV